MKISKTTLAVLLSTAAVQALPADPPVATPPPTIPDGVLDTIDDLGSVAGRTIEGIISGIPKLIAEILDAKRAKESTKNEQERQDEDERIEKLKEALDERREIAVKRLEYAEEIQIEKGDLAGIVQAEYDDTLTEIASLNKEIAELSERKKSADAELLNAERAKQASKLEVDKAYKDLGAAVQEANELREAIHQIDEQAAVIELPPEDWNVVNPELPVPPKEAEEPEGDKKKHNTHNHN